MTEDLAVLEVTLSAEEADGLYSSCLLVREGKPGAETMEVASVLLDYGGLLHMMGKTEEAESKIRRSLAIRERALGSQHPDVAEVLTGKVNNLNRGICKAQHPKEGSC